MLSNHRIIFHPHDQERCLDAAIINAKKVCAQKNTKLSTMRESVLVLIWQGHKPKGAYDILDGVAKTTGKSIAPPTIYRALDFLLDMGLIHRIASLNAYIGCPFPSHEHSNLFMICEHCGSTAEIADTGLNNTLSSICVSADFTLKTQYIELKGLCPKCQSESANSEQ